MLYIIQPSFGRSREVCTNEKLFTARWAEVRRVRDSGAWIVLDGNQWFGTDHINIKGRGPTLAGERSDRYCVECRKGYTSHLGDTLHMCPACYLLAFPTVQPWTQPKPKVRLPIPAPAVGVHCAGAPTPYVGAEGAEVQRCAVCGAILKAWTDDVATLPRTLPAGNWYPVGALVERGRGWQAMSLQATDPTCVPAEVHTNVAGETFTDADLNQAGQNWTD